MLLSGEGSPADDWCKKHGIFSINPWIGACNRMIFRPQQRLMMISIAGGCDSMLKSWFDRDELPNLASIWSGSVSGSLRSSQPANASVAWTSMMTGRTTPHHGVYDPEFLAFDRKTIQQTHIGRIMVPHLWQILSRAGRSVVSIHAPLSFGIKAEGVRILAASDSPVRGSRTTSDLALPKSIACNWSQSRLWNRRPKSVDEAVGVAERHKLHNAALADMAEFADKQGDWALMHVNFQDLDGLQHAFWPELEVDATAILARPEWLSIVRDTLRSLDQSVGRLAELAEKQKAGLMVVSDHGFGPCRALVNVNGILRIHGIQRRQSLGGAILHHSRRAFGTLAERLPASRKAYRSIDLSHACDWSSSLAFAPFGQHSGLIYLTDKARAHEGRAERATHEVAEIFRLIAEPESGEPVFSDVIPVANRWGIDPVATGWPDIMAIPADGYEPRANWNHKEKVRLFRPDTNQPGTHYADGVVALKGSGLESGRISRCQVQDIAPTILKWLDIQPPESMEGRIIGTQAENSIYQPHIRPNSGRKVIVSTRQSNSSEIPLY